MKIPTLIILLFTVPAVVAMADVSLPGAHYPTDAVVSPSAAGTDYWIYEEVTPGNLVLTNNPSSLQGVLGGHAGAPGGNVELFPTSEWAQFADVSAGGAFASVAPTTLSGTAGSTAFTFRSLNGSDWFGTGSGYDTSFGAATLATQWFNGFVDSVASLMGNPFAAAALSAARADLFDAWRDAGGFASLSDANIGYIYGMGDGSLNFGLEGFLDASPRFRQLLDDAGYGGFTMFVPDGIQYSEVVILNDEAYYSFNNATPSGVQLDDEPFHSYTADFAFTTGAVPEPSSITCLLVAAGIPLLRRRRSA